MTDAVLTVLDETGEKVVVLPHIIFRGRQAISWDEVEKYICRYVGSIFNIEETNDLIYIGNDFPDEFTGSTYTRKLLGGLAKAKANLVQGLPQIIEIATDKRWQMDFEDKHKKRASNGWYRYNTKFALPIMSDNGDIIRYNKYKAVLLVRYSSNGKLYLYDVQNIKKK